MTLEQTPKQSERMSHAAFWGKNILGRENTCKGSEAEVSLGYWSKIRRSEGWDGEGDEIGKAATYLALLSHGASFGFHC